MAVKSEVDVGVLVGGEIVDENVADMTQDQIQTNNTTDVTPSYPTRDAISPEPNVEPNSNPMTIKHCAYMSKGYPFQLSYARSWRVMLIAGQARIFVLWDSVLCVLNI